MRKCYHLLVAILVCPVIYLSGFLGSLIVAPANAVNLQLGVSDDTIPISSNFDGKTITVFGTIENYDPLALAGGSYKVVIEVTGPRKQVVMRRKERVFGIWVNRKARLFSNVPQFYMTATNSGFDEIASQEELKNIDLGVNNLEINLLSKGTATHILPAPSFSNSLRRLRVNNGLFAEHDDALQFLSATLFRAAIELPANVPLGSHEVKAYLFEDGKPVADLATNFTVLKTGFEQWIYNLAYEHSFLYGVLAVLLAIFTGWLANAIFKKE